MEHFPVRLYDFASFELTTFVVANALIFIGLFVFFAVVLWKKPWLYLHPSVLLGAVYAGLIGLPFAVFSDYFQRALATPWVMSALIASVTLPGAAMAVWRWGIPAPRRWQALSEPVPLRQLWLAFTAVAVCGMPLLLYYFSQVPFGCTALYSLFDQPFMLGIYREISLSLIQPLGLRYAYAFYSLTLAKIMVCLLTIIAARYAGQKCRLKAFLCVLLLIAVGLSGAANGATANLFFTGGVALLTLAWQAKLAVWRGKYLALAVLCLLPALVIKSVVRYDLYHRGATLAEVQAQMPAFERCLAHLPLKPEAHDRQWILGLLALSAQDEKRLLGKDSHASAAADAGPLAVNAQSEAVFYLSRMFLSPTLMGGWFVDYAQRFGTDFWSAYPKLAALLGKPAGDLPNAIGRFYGPSHYGAEVSSTISANTGFIFAHYASIGAWAMLLNIVCVFLWEGVGWCAGRLPGALIPVFYAMLTYATIFLPQAAFGTVIMLEGPLFFLALAAFFCVRHRLRKVETC